MTEHEGPTIGSIQLDLRILGARLCHFGHRWLDLGPVDADDVRQAVALIGEIDRLSEQLEKLTDEVCD